MRVRTDGQTDAQTQTGFIICPMLNAIAVGQIKMRFRRVICIPTTACALDAPDVIAMNWLRPIWRKPCADMLDHFYKQ